MPAYKDTGNTWRAVYRYTDWKGTRRQTQKRGFATKHEALAWEREQTKQEITAGTYLLDTECDIAILKDSKALYNVGTGVLKHGTNGFILDGCGGKLHYEQAPQASYSVNSDYFWYEIGDIISIGTNDCLYYCFPKGNESVAKVRLAGEELYKLSKHPS